MAIDVFDTKRDELHSVESTGQPGELVCTRPFPSQPIEFLGADGRERYRKSYFDRCGPGAWCQGDSIMLCPTTKGFVIVGRSDGVLNPSGVRFGPAEIYAVMETFTAEVEDALCAGQRRKDDEDEAVLLFVKLQLHLKGLKPELAERIRVAIREKCSPRHVPAHIFSVAEIPYTSNGKKCEINVKHVVNGVETEIGSTVANPENFKLYRQYASLPKVTTMARKISKSKL
jgi:acetoacetyl-CoA synthetase